MRWYVQESAYTWVFVDFQAALRFHKISMSLGRNPIFGVGKVQEGFVP